MVFVPNDDSVMDLVVTTMGIAIFRRARNVFGKGALPKIGHRPLDIVKTGMTVAVARCVRAEGASVWGTMRITPAKLKGIRTRS